ncbi:uncharacterized protein ACRADG_010670 isoform 1-T1 [Cochliomyia hominivorax]
MNCFCNRYTCGVIIGSLYLAAFIVAFTVSTLFLIIINSDRNTHEFRKPESSIGVIAVMVKCSILAGICALLIWAIVKRRHRYMLPFMLVYVVGFAFSILFTFYWFMGAVLGNATKTDFLIILIVSILAMVLQIAIFIFIYILYKDIQSENNENLRPIIIVPQMKSINLLPIFCVVVTAILLLGIVKKRHALMIPWLLFYIKVFLITGYFISSEIQYFAHLEFTEISVAIILALALEIIMFFFMHNVYREFRKETETVAEEVHQPTATCYTEDNNIIIKIANV